MRTEAEIRHAISVIERTVKVSTHVNDKDYVEKSRIVLDVMRWVLGEDNAAGRAFSACSVIERASRQ